MFSLYPYFYFNGNCKEAMLFYQSCFGGEVEFTTVGNSPMSKQLPENMAKAILHASLKINGNYFIMGTDLMHESKRPSSNATSILIQCKDEQEIYNLFEKLSIDGEINHPIERTFWNALLGGVTDKYSNNWLLNTL